MENQTNNNYLFKKIYDRKYKFSETTVLTFKINIVDRCRKSWRCTHKNKTSLRNRLGNRLKLAVLIAVKEF